MSDTPEPTAAHRPARLALAFLAASLVLAVGLVFQGGYQNFSGAGPAAEAALRAVGIGLICVSVVLAILGILTLIAALRQIVRRTRRSTVVAVVLGPLVVGFWVVLLALIPFLGTGLVLLVALSVAATIVLAAGPPFSPPGRRSTNGGSRAARAIGLALANLAVIALGTLHILLWNPLARVPGFTIDELYSEMAARGESGGGIMIAPWVVVWGLASFALAVAGSLPRTAAVLTPRRVVVLGLLLIGVTVFFHWWAGFAMGMSLADAFATTGGDAAVSGPILAIVGQLALVAAVFTALLPGGAVRNGTESMPELSTPKTSPQPPEESPTRG